jgi:hypothetical protein
MSTPVLLETVGLVIFSKYGRSGTFVVVSPSFIRAKFYSVQVLFSPSFIWFNFYMVQDLFGSIFIWSKIYLVQVLFGPELRDLAASFSC